MPDRIPDSHHDLLDGEVALATVGPDGHPQVTAIVVRVAEDGIVETALNTARQKYRNVVRDPRVTLFRADPQVPIRTIEVRATAEIIDDPDRSWSRSFGFDLGFDIDAVDLPGERRVRVRFHPEKVNVLQPDIAG